MSIIDNILGGGGDQQNTDYSNDQNTFDSVFATNPNAGFDASDILHSQSSEHDGSDSEQDSFTGIGDIGFDVSAPTVVGVSTSNSSEQYSNSESDDNGGGLLGGLL